MLLLSTALAQTVTDVAWHGHGVARPSERLVVDGQIFGLRVDGETAVLERYDEDLEVAWATVLELPPSTAKRQGRMAFPLIEGGGAIVVLVPMADNLAALVHDPETGERLQTRKLADYGSVNRIEVLVGDETFALLEGEEARLWRHDLEELGTRPAAGAWRALDGEEVVRAWVSGNDLTLARGSKRVQLTAPEGLVNARLSARGGRAWLVGTLRGENQIWAAHVDFQSEGLLWVASLETPGGRPRLLELAPVDEGVVVVSTMGDHELSLGLADGEGWAWSAGMPGTGPATLCAAGLLYGNRLREVNLDNGALGHDKPILPPDLGKWEAPVLIEERLVLTTQRDLMVAVDLTRLPPAPGGLAGTTAPDLRSRAYRAGRILGTQQDTKHQGAALAGFAATVVPTAAVGGGLGAGLGLLGAGAAAGVSARWAPRPPPSRWAHLPSDFQQGYLDAYAESTRKRQVSWVLVGSSVGLLTGLLVS